MPTPQPHGQNRPLKYKIVEMRINPIAAPNRSHGLAAATNR
jgi:hypothetical protein